MRRRAAKVFIVGGVAVLAAVLVARLRPRAEPPPPIPYRFPTAELAALDYVVQARFAVPPTNDFGARRIGERHEYFKAINPDEQEAVRALERSKQQVLFYVVGTHVLNGARDFGGDVPVQGPIFITHGKMETVKPKPYPPYTRAMRFQSEGNLPRDTPSDDELTAIARVVYEDHARSRGMSGRQGNWHYEAVPVMASDQSCIDCHNTHPVKRKERRFFWEGPWRSLKVGEPLGIAIYCYRPEKG